MSRTKLVVYPYKMSSRSARELAGALNARRVWPNRRYRPRASHIVLNWGNTQIPDWYQAGRRWLNHPVCVQRSVDKLTCLRILQANDVPVPEYTTDPYDADNWLLNGEGVVERHVLNGHSGKGIVIKYEGTVDERAHFYTKYVGSRREYRVHVFHDDVLLVVQKRRRNGVEQDDVVRNWHTGWVYCAENITPLSAEAIADAVASVKALGLDFGAVDLITRRGEHYVLEVNTATGLEGRTVSLYSDAIQAYIAGP